MALKPESFSLFCSDWIDCSDLMLINGYLSENHSTAVSALLDDALSASYNAKIPPVTLLFFWKDGLFNRSSVGGLKSFHSFMM